MRGRTSAGYSFYGIMLVSLKPRVCRMLSRVLCTLSSTVLVLPPPPPRILRRLCHTDWLQYDAETKLPINWGNYTSPRVRPGSYDLCGKTDSKVLLSRWGSPSICVFDGR